MLVHRLAYETFVEPAGDLDVLHKCDNPPCFNPAHLYKGTDVDNRRDMVERGRVVTLRGSEVGTSILTEALVAEIKRRLPHDNDQVLARAFGMSDSLIWNIRHGVSWRHVDAAL